MAAQAIQRSEKLTGAGAGGGREAWSDGLLTFAALGGAAAGALAVAEFGSAPYVSWGALGAALGGGFAAAGWEMVTFLWSRASVGYEDGHTRDHAAARQVIPGPNAG